MLALFLLFLWVSGRKVFTGNERENVIIMKALFYPVGFYCPYWLEGDYVTEEGDVVPMFFGTFRRCSYLRGRLDGQVDVFF